MKQNKDRTNQYVFVKRAISFSKGKNTVMFGCETSEGNRTTVKLEFCTSKLFRFYLIPNPQVYKKKINLVKKANWEDVQFQIKEFSNLYLIKTDYLEIIINKEPWELSIYNSKQELVCKENTSDTDVLGKYIAKPLGFKKRGNTIDSIYETMLLAPDEHFYGFGEKFTPLDKRGQRIISWTVDPLSTNTEKSYKNIPFFMSTKGYGVFINSTNRIEYKMGTESSISYSFEVDDSSLTGKSPVPPKWSFGLWMSRYSYKSREELEKVSTKIRENNIPCDVINLDSFWMEKGKQCNLEWNKKAFPDPEGMIKKLKKRGFKLSLWEQPHIPVGTSIFKEGVEKGYFITKEDGSVYVSDICLTGEPNDKKPFTSGAIVDFTNPEAVKWYQEKHRYLLDMGVSVFKTDFGEYVPQDSHFHNGLTGKEMRNIYSLLYNKAVFEITQEIRDKKGIVWGRSGYAGSQSYPVQWSGDSKCNFPSMMCNLKAGLGYGLSGVPFWSNDIGGFKGTPTEELYIRWVQFGMFCSHSRCHGNSPREPWFFGDRALKIFKFYAKLRYRLIPYIYSYAYIAHQTGLPIMRAMVLEYQDDPNTYDKDLQYLFGREFLVAPIYNKSLKRFIYLPKGRWIDYWNHKEYKGPLNLSYKANLETIPLFVKGDSIIPMGPEMSYVGEKLDDPLTLDIYIYSNAQFELYDDKKIVSLRCQRKNAKIVLDIGSSNHTYIAKFNKMNEPEGIKSNIGKIEHCTKESLNKLKQGWYFDKFQRILWVKLLVKKEGRLEIREERR